MMNFLPLCKAIIQHQRVNKGSYRFGIKNRKADDMRYKTLIIWKTATVRSAIHLLRTASVRL